MAQQAEGMPEVPALGIIMLNTRFPRVVGDIGNPKTFAFPVRYRIVEQATVDQVVREDGLSAGPGRRLRRGGARACRRRRRGPHHVLRLRRDLPGRAGAALPAADGRLQPLPGAAGPGGAAGRPPRRRDHDRCAQADAGASGRRRRARRHALRRHRGRRRAHPGDRAGPAGARSGPGVPGCAGRRRGPGRQGAGRRRDRAGVHQHGALCARAGRASRAARVRHPEPARVVASRAFARRGSDGPVADSAGALDTAACNASARSARGSRGERHHATVMQPSRSGHDAHDQGARRRQPGRRQGRVRDGDRMAGRCGRA